MHRVARCPDPSALDAAYAGKTVTVALAHGAPGIHGRLRQLIGPTDPARRVPGTIRGDLGEDTLAAARDERRLVRNLVHTSDDPDAARRDLGTWFGSVADIRPSQFGRCSVVLCKPDAVERGLVDVVLDRIASAGAVIGHRMDVVVRPWQAQCTTGISSSTPTTSPTGTSPGAWTRRTPAGASLSPWPTGSRVCMPVCVRSWGTSTRPGPPPAPFAATSARAVSRPRSPRGG
nr:nucleoside-diphosphate kinase [Streptomyces sp. SID4982]